METRRVSSSDRKFELRQIWPSGARQIYHYKTVEAAHAALGQIAGERGLSLHVHEGNWSEAAYSTAYQGDDYLLGAIACVTTYRGR